MLIFMAFLVWGLYAILSCYLMLQIRLNYGDIYKKYGSPPVFLSSPAQIPFIYDFVLMGDYKQEPVDREIRGLCAALRFLFFAGVVVLVIIFFS